MQNGKPDQPQAGEGIIEIPVEWRRMGDQYQVKLQTVRFANVQGGWETVIDMMIEGLRVARREARQVQAQRIQVTGQMPKGVD